MNKPKTIRINYALMLILRWLAGLWVGAFINGHVPPAFEGPIGSWTTLHWWSWPYLITSIVFFAGSLVYYVWRLLSYLIDNKIEAMLSAT